MADIVKPEGPPPLAALQPTLSWSTVIESSPSPVFFLYLVEDIHVVTEHLSLLRFEDVALLFRPPECQNQPKT